MSIQNWFLEGGFLTRNQTTYGSAIIRIEKIRHCIAFVWILSTYKMRERERESTVRKISKWKGRHGSMWMAELVSIRSFFQLSAPRDTYFSLSLSLMCMCVCTCVHVFVWARKRKRWRKTVCVAAAMYLKEVAITRFLMTMSYGRMGLAVTLQPAPRAKIHKPDIDPERTIDGTRAVLTTMNNIQNLNKALGVGSATWQTEVGGLY